MSNQPAKKQPQSKKLQQSKTNSTQSDADRRVAEAEARAEAAEAKAEKAMNAFDRAMGHLQTLSDFHEAIDGASDADLRIWWDVRILRGKDEPFARTTGSSSLPNALSDKMKVNAQAVVQNEIVDKIARPLSTRLMEEQEKALKLSDDDSLDDIDHRGRQRLPAPKETTGDPLLDIAAEEEEEPGEEEPQEARVPVEHDQPEKKEGTES